MLDECASGYMRARIKTRDATNKAYADRTFEQRMLIYGHSSVDRNDAQFYLLMAQAGDRYRADGCISLAVERYQSLCVWTNEQ